MFHMSNLGCFGANLPADMEGYVPEVGDHHSDMRFDSANEWNEENWLEFVENAVNETKEAEKALENWRTGE